jgi:hypothetical protein
MGLALQHLSRYHNEGHNMLAQIVTCNEFWVRHYQGETNRASMRWKHSALPTKESLPSSRKVMLIAFWDHEGILHTTFQPQGQIVNADSYCNFIMKLRKAIQRKRPRLLTKGVLLCV